MCSTSDIERALYCLYDFRGVYALDKLPDRLYNGGYVINTQTSNLPGEHWIAIYIRPDRINVYNPLGIYYHSILVRKLKRMQQPVFYNNKMDQNPFSFLCGQHCISWLYKQNNKK